MKTLILAAAATLLAAAHAAAADFAPFLSDAALTLSSTYYGRARSADNRDRAGAGTHAGEIHVNAFGQSAAFRSGYAWDVIGFDATAQTNLGRGNGNSEVLFHNADTNQDRSSLTLGQAALKTRIAVPHAGVVWEARAGFTPISTGTLGTSGGLHPHAYRGFETKLKMNNWTLGYGWADRFKNEWDNRYREMTAAWHQNRHGDKSGKRIRSIHSLGLRYEWGEEKDAYIDIGAGEGGGYRKNAQAVISVPFQTGGAGKLTLTAYGLIAKYGDLFSAAEKHTEHHVSAQAEFESGNWTFALGLGHTRAPDSEEMQFRLTAWGNSDNRNSIQTWGQLDDFVWDGQTVGKAEARYAFGELIGLPGLSAGAKFLYARKNAARELDCHIEYAVPEGRLKGLSAGVYAGRLRWGGNRFPGKQDRNDVKFILSYARSFEYFLRKK